MYGLFSATFDKLTCIYILTFIIIIIIIVTTTTTTINIIIIITIIIIIIIITVEPRYLEFAYFELPLISKWKSSPCFNMKLWKQVTK